MLQDFSGGDLAHICDVMFCSYEIHKGETKTQWQTTGCQKVEDRNEKTDTPELLPTAPHYSPLLPTTPQYALPKCSQPPTHFCIVQVHDVLLRAKRRHSADVARRVVCHLAGPLVHLLGLLRGALQDVHLRRIRVWDVQFSF